MNNNNAQLIKKLCYEAPKKFITGNIVYNDSKELIGIISDVYDNSIDVMFFSPMILGDDHSLIILAESLHIEEIAKIFKSTLSKNPEMIDVWENIRIKSKLDKEEHEQINRTDNK